MITRTNAFKMSEHNSKPGIRNMSVTNIDRHTSLSECFTFRFFSNNTKFYNRSLSIPGWCSLHKERTII